MRHRNVFFLIVFCLTWTSMGSAQEAALQSFLERSSKRSIEASKQERLELLVHVEKVLEQSKQTQLRIKRAIQGGEADIRYQEGQFWVNRLEEDQKAIEAGAEQIRILREKPANLVAAIKLYKSLRDLAVHFNSCSNMPSFAAFIGELAPELELWADPVFYKIYLLPLAQAKDVEPKPVAKEKRSEGKGKRSEGDPPRRDRKVQDGTKASSKSRERSKGGE